MVKNFVLDDNSVDALPSDLFGYEILELLGEGVGSRVYRARGADGRPVALKHVQIPDEPALRFFEQLKNEYERGRAISSGPLRRALALKTRRAYLVGPVQEAGLVLEFVEGSSLELRKCPTEATVLNVFSEVAQGLRALHRLGFLHADVRPGNILVNDSGRAKLIDYGHSCKLGTARPYGRDLPDYQAPEQLEGQPMTFRTDVFNFGGALYWALCRRSVPNVPPRPTAPVKKGREPDVKERSPFPAPHEVNPRIPLPLSKFILRCLELDPEARPSGMDMALAVLEEAKDTLAHASPPSRDRANAASAK